MLATVTLTRVLWSCFSSGRLPGHASRKVDRYAVGDTPTARGKCRAQGGGGAHAAAGGDLLDGRHRGPGALAPGEAFDAADVLAALERDLDDLVVRRDWPAPRPVTA